jgi:hypothetical protein
VCTIKPRLSVKAGPVIAMMEAVIRSMSEPTILNGELFGDLNYPCEEIRESASNAFSVHFQMVALLGASLTKSIRSNWINNALGADMVATGALTSGRRLH